MNNFEYVLLFSVGESPTLSFCLLFTQASSVRLLSNQGLTHCLHSISVTMSISSVTIVSSLISHY